MTSLILSFLPLIAAPWLCRLCARTARLAEFMDGFLFITIAGLVLLGVLPQAWTHGGWAVMAFLALGLLLPVVTERALRHVGEVHRVALILGLSGLLLHAITDGAALSQGGNHAAVGEVVDGEFLSLSVLLHRLPVGLTVWWLVYPQFGLWAASTVLSVIGLGTVVGFVFAPEIMEPLSTRGMAYFQAFVAGSLVHVLYHRPHASGADHEHHHHNHNHGASASWPEGVGNVLGAGLVVFLAVQHEHDAQWGWLESMEHMLLDLALACAPALLLAFGLSAGLRLLWWSLRPGRAASASAGPAREIISALLGFEAVLLPLVVFGSEFMLARIIAALVLALLIVLLLRRADVGLSAVHKHADGVEWGDSPRERTNIGAHGVTLLKQLMAVVERGAPDFALGLFIAVLMQILLHDRSLPVPPAQLDVVLLVAVGLLCRLSAASAIPALAILLIEGVSGGAALALLIVGPLIYPRLIRRIAERYGRAHALRYVVLVAGFAVAAGLGLNFWVPDCQTQAWMSAEQGLMAYSSLCLLVLLFLAVLLRRGARALVMSPVA